MSEYNIGSKLKELRKAKKLTLQDVASETGFSAALISQIENNNISPPIATLSKIANFFDVRTFGAVMSTGDNCGQVRGPIQINFSRSIDPIVQQEVTITRQTVTRIEDADKERTMGRKHIVPYGLYRVEGYVSAKLANDATKGTGFSEEDLALFWEALINMFEHDHSAARGKMATRKLVIFKHESDLGNAPSHQLFDLVKVTRNPEANPPRSFGDYSVRVDTAKAPGGVTIIDK